MTDKHTWEFRVKYWAAGAAKAALLGCVLASLVQTAQAQWQEPVLKWIGLKLAEKSFDWGWSRATEPAGPKCRLTVYAKIIHWKYHLVDYRFMDTDSPPSPQGVFITQDFQADYEPLGGGVVYLARYNGYSVQSSGNSEWNMTNREPFGIIAPLTRWEYECKNDFTNNAGVAVGHYRRMDNEEFGVVLGVDEVPLTEVVNGPFTVHARYGAKKLPGSCDEIPPSEDLSSIEVTKEVPPDAEVDGTPKDINIQCSKVWTFLDPKEPKHPKKS